MSRGTRWAEQLADQQISRPENGQLKRKERARRDAKLKEFLTKGKFPYTPTIMSWLSAKLKKPSRYIREEDVKSYLSK